MAILYVASEAAELKPFAQLLTGVRKLNWPVDYAFEGILDGKRMLLAANGAGPKLAAHVVETALRAAMAAELSSSRLEAVVSTGFCGALDDSLALSDIVVADKVICPEETDVFDCAPINTSTPHASGTVLSQNRVANTAEEKRKLGGLGAVAVDMEAGGVARRAKRAGLPFCCIKVVTDCAHDSFPFDVNGMRTPEGRIARGKILIHALARPALLPALFKLKRCTENAAMRLGDFLASCRIVSEPVEHGTDPVRL